MRRWSGFSEEADEVFISSIALGEPFYGAERSRSRDANLAQVEAFASANAILPYSGQLTLLRRDQEFTEGQGASAA